MTRHIQSIERAAAILRLLAAAPHGLGLHEVSDATGLAKPTAHGILATLRHVGFVDQDRGTGHYRLTPDTMAACAQSIDPHLLRSHAMNWCDSLAAHSGHAVLVGVLADTEVEVVHHVFAPDARPQRLLFGEKMPAHATALGKVLLAFTAGTSRDAVPVRYTARTVVDPDRLAHEIRGIQAAGHAVAVGELRPELAAVAAPIRGIGGICVGAVAAGGRTDRICPDGRSPRRDLVDRVVRAARSVGTELARAS